MYRSFFLPQQNTCVRLQYIIYTFKLLLVSLLRLYLTSHSEELKAGPSKLDFCTESIDEGRAPSEMKSKLGVNLHIHLRNCTQ